MSVPRQCADPSPHPEHPWTEVTHPGSSRLGVSYTRHYACDGIHHGTVTVRVPPGTTVSSDDDGARIIATAMEDIPAGEPVVIDLTTGMMRRRR